MKKIILPLLITLLYSAVCFAEQGVYDLSLSADLSGATMAPSGSSTFTINNTADLNTIDKTHKREGNVTFQIKPGGVSLYYHGQGGDDSGTTFTVFAKCSNYDTAAGWAGAEEIVLLDGVSISSGESVYVVEAPLPAGCGNVQFGLKSGVTPPQEVQARATFW